MTKPGNFDPAICTLKLSGQILVGLAYTLGWLWHDHIRKNLKHEFRVIRDNNGKSEEIRSDMAR